VTPLFDAAALDQLGEAVRRDFGSAAVTEVLGIAGDAALSRNDLAGAERLTRAGSATETWIQLFLLGLPVPAAAAAAALEPLGLAEAIAAGLLDQDSSGVRAALAVRPYAESGGPDWWVVSDLGTELRPGILDA
jgi:hypothetical protein